MSARDTTAVALFAKAPVAGQVKTRLVPPLREEEAAGVARACFEQTIALLPRTAELEFFLYLDGDLDDAMEAVARMRRIQVRSQASGDLGARLRGAFSELLAEGFPRALAIGSDSPTLPPGRLLAAAAALRAHDAVLGPSEDGGYYLLGVSRPVWELLEEIPWSTSRVTELTRSRAVAGGVSLAELEPWYDVDDLETLRRAVSDSGPDSPLARCAADLPPPAMSRL